MDVANSLAKWLILRKIANDKIPNPLYSYLKSWGPPLFFFKIPNKKQIEKIINSIDIIYLYKM